MDIDKLIEQAIESLFESVESSIKDISKEELKIHLEKYTQSKKDQIEKMHPEELPDMIAQQMMKSVIYQIDAAIALKRLSKIKFMAEVAEKNTRGMH